MNVVPRPKISLKPLSKIRGPLLLTSGEYLPRFVMTPSSQEMESPAIPGQFIHL